MEHTSCFTRESIDRPEAEAAITKIWHFTHTIIYFCTRLILFTTIFCYWHFDGAGAGCERATPDLGIIWQGVFG
jgi:hypothetical protein